MAACSPLTSKTSFVSLPFTLVGACPQAAVSSRKMAVANACRCALGLTDFASGKTMTRYGNVSVFDMGSSVVLKGVAACNVAARVLPTHRHQTAHPGLDDVGSPDTHDARRSESARSPWGSGAVGVFSFAHGTNGRFFCATEPHNSSQQG